MNIRLYRYFDMSYVTVSSRQIVFPALHALECLIINPLFLRPRR